MKRLLVLLASLLILLARIVRQRKSAELTRNWLQRLSVALERRRSNSVRTQDCTATDGTS